MRKALVFLLMATCSLWGGQVAPSRKSLALLRRQAAACSRALAGSHSLSKSELSGRSPAVKRLFCGSWSNWSSCSERDLTTDQPHFPGREYHKRGNNSICLSSCHVLATVLSSLLVLSYLILKANPMRQVLLCPLDGLETGADEMD